MLLLAQLVGGGGYLLQKILLSLAEYAKRRRGPREQTWRIWAWTFYLIGAPAWLYIFWGNEWIAFGVEISGIPSMVAGLVVALRGGNPESIPKWLDRVALLCIPIGLAVSLIDFGGLTEFSQWLEIGLSVGYLVGTYQLARQHQSGYIWYVLMHVSCACLMSEKGLQWLFWQQIVSLAFILIAYLLSRHAPKDVSS